MVSIALIRAVTLPFLGGAEPGMDGLADDVPVPVDDVADAFDVPSGTRTTQPGDGRWPAMGSSAGSSA